ncbi:MAG TPA: hypothetical protein VEF71_24220 [Streptosporangiaceae bacterium]|nr:hypothetical protein [Streptosporangiaceae bacterium]
MTMVPAESAKDLFYAERSVADAPAVLVNQRPGFRVSVPQIQV